MRYYDIETFLAIVRYRSLSQAASALFIAQSTVSQRLKKLEDEIGSPLVSRKRGMKEVELTPKGEQFIAVAEQMLNIWKEAESICSEPDYFPFSIGAVENLTATMLPQLFAQVLSQDPHILLSSFTAHSVTLYNMVDRRELDVAFVVRKIDVPSIRITPILTERMLLVCKRGFLPSGVVELAQLDVHKEIFCSWGVEFREWHSGVWGRSAKPLVEVDSMSLFLHMSASLDCWFICPESIAQFCRKYHDLEIHELGFPAPQRTIYLIERSSQLNNRKHGMEVLLACLEQKKDLLF